VTASLLTAIIPVGPEHLENNRLSNWVLEANRFSDELNLIIVLDSKTLEIAQQYEFKEILVRISLVKFVESQVCNSSIDALGNQFSFNTSNRKTYCRSFI
jgi:hypothetical protein